MLANWVKFVPSVLRKTIVRRGTRDKALLLRVEGRLRLRRVGAPDVLYETVQNAMSEAAWTTDPWGEDSAQDLRNAMMQSLRALADKMMLDLTRATATR